MYTIDNVKTNRLSEEIEKVKQVLFTTVAALWE